jgi:hypothetical protein
MISRVNCSISCWRSRHLGGKLVPRPSWRWRQWRSVTICRELKHSDQTIKSEHSGTNRRPITALLTCVCNLGDADRVWRLTRHGTDGPPDEVAVVRRSISSCFQDRGGELCRQAHFRFAPKARAPTKPAAKEPPARDTRTHVGVVYWRGCSAEPPLNAPTAPT